MAKKVVASLRDTSGVKYAKLIQSVKSKKSGSYVFKEEIIMEDHVKDILAGKSQQDIIRELRAKEKEAEAAKQAQANEKAPAAEAPKEEAPKEELLRHLKKKHLKRRLLLLLRHLKKKHLKKRLLCCC